MNVSGFQEAVASAVSRDGRYRPEGYQFLRDSLDATIKRRSKGRKDPPASHVTASELLDGFRNLALKEFGPMAPTVLEYWGIASCVDVGRMVFHLVECGAFSRTEEDTFEGFEKGFDFHEAFVVPFLPPGSPSLDHPAPEGMLLKS
ncbi:MAG: Minf_1886 family protein [Chthoniobacterales bacterium]|jgi:uncharacterized repeat protein (TIGR04138 family)